MGRPKTFDPSGTRTVALVGHRSSGKTSTGEALITVSGVTRTLGSVDRKTSLLDHHPGERRGRLSLENSYAWLDWDGVLVNLVDTPGSAVLAHERDLALCAVDGAILVIDGTRGVELGTEQVLDRAIQGGLPLLAVFNKMDHDHDFDALLADLERAASRRVLALQLPFHDDDGTFAGMISLTEMRVLRFDPEGSGAYSPEPVPERYRQQAANAWERLVEAVALTDDDLLETYLEYMELPRDRVLDGLARAVRANQVLPVVVASATRGIGAQPLLDALVTLMPSPSERRQPEARTPDGQPLWEGMGDAFVAQLLSSHFDADGEPYSVLRIWNGEPPRSGRWLDTATRTESRVRKLYQLRGPRRSQARSLVAGAIVATWDPLDGRPGETFTDGALIAMPAPEVPPPMMAYLLSAADPQSARKLPEALKGLQRIDTGLRLLTDAATGGTLLAGLSDRHLALALERLERTWGVRVRATLPPVPYRETPLAPVDDVEGVHLLEDHRGLVEEFGACRIDIAPQAPDLGNRFVDRVDDGEDLPSRYRPAVDEGARHAMEHGPTAGYPVVGVDMSLRGGEYDCLQSTDDHFRLAGENAIRNALARAGTRLLEPWSTLEVTLPDESIGDVLSDISSHRGRILGVDTSPDGRNAHIRALCPVRELRTFASRLEATTGGRGRFSTALSHYEPLPQHLVREAIASSPFLEQRGRYTEAGNSRSQDRMRG